MKSRGLFARLAASAVLAACLFSGLSPATTDPAAADPGAVEAAKSELDRIQAEADQINIEYQNSLRELEVSQKQYDAAIAAAEAQRVQVQQMQQELGDVARITYQTADSNVTVRLLTSESDDAFLNEVATIQNVTDRSNSKLQDFQAAQGELARLEEQARVTLVAIETETNRQAQLVADYQAKELQAKVVYEQLSAEEKQRIAELDMQQAQDDAQRSFDNVSREEDRTTYYLPPNSSMGLRPVPGPITSRFGYRTHPISGVSNFHKGVDIAPPCGTPIRSAWSGVIAESSYMGGYGNMVLVKHGTVNGTQLMTRYAHMQSTSSLAPGTAVEAGTIIGRVGTTGNSTGCHLHFETITSGGLVDPLGLISSVA